MTRLEPVAQLLESKGDLVNMAIWVGSLCPGLHLERKLIASSTQVHQEMVLIFLPT